MNLDIIPNGAIKRVHVSQNDVGRTLTFALFNNSTTYAIPSGAVVKIQGTKPSGFGFSETCTVSGNTATIDTTEAMTDESGNIQTELSISYDDVVIGTSNFVLAVEKNPHPDTTTDGSMETIIPELTLLVNEVKGYAEEIEGTYHAYGSPWVASTVAQMTDTDKIYVYVGSETGYTSGNWYYYNGSSWASGGVYNSVAVQTDTTLSVSGIPADAKAVGDDVDEIRDAYYKDTKNLCPNPTASTVNGGYLNGSTGTFGTVEAGKTYTFSATNESSIGKSLGLRIMNGSWVNQTNIYTTPSARFSGTFTATVDGDISLNASYGADYSPIFTEIQLEEGSVVTDYVEYNKTYYTANDKLVRNDIYAKSIIDDCTITDGKWFADNRQANESLISWDGSGYYTVLIPVDEGKEYTIYGSIANAKFCYFAISNVVVRVLTTDDYTLDSNAIHIAIPNGVNQLALTGLDSTLSYANVNVIEGNVIDVIPTLSAIPSGTYYRDVYTKAEVANMIGDSYITNYIYVSTNGNDATGDGTKSNPYATVYHAYETITHNSENNRYQIVVEDGTYTDLQTRYSGITGTSYQGVMSKDYVSVKSASGNPSNCIFEWDGSTGFNTFTEADATYKCFFHLNDHSRGVTIEGIKFVGANLRYCLHFETNQESSVEIKNCVFEWAGVYSATDDHKNRTVIGMGGSYFQNVTFNQCRFYNSQNTAGVQWHDNIPYKTYDYPLGAILTFNDCYFDGLNIQVRSRGDCGDRTTNVFSLALNRCSGLNIVYPTITNGTLNYWRATIGSCRIDDDRMSDCTDSTTYAEQTTVKS